MKNRLTRRHLLMAGSALALGAPHIRTAAAQDVVKIGLLLPSTGPFASTARQVDAGTKLYQQVNGMMAGGRRVELVVRDDTATPDVTRRLAQELIVNERVSFLAGFGLTPLALATAPLATQSRTPMVVMAAATSAIPEASPFIVHSSFTISQTTVPLADWARRNNVARMMSMVTDYAPGIEGEASFKARFESQGGQVTEALRVPLRNPDFAPFLQRVRDTNAQAVFVFVPSGAGALFMRQFQERGLDRAGVRLISTGDVTDDDLLNEIGDVAVGAVTSHHYSAVHPGDTNANFVRAYRAANANRRPNFMAVGGYDGMHLIYRALEATRGVTTDGEALVNAMKGMNWESPRGPARIEQNRGITCNIYIRRVERRDGELYNVEFETVPMVVDPGRTNR